MPETKKPEVRIKNFQKRSFYILNPISGFLTCSPKHSWPDKQKNVQPHC